MRARTGLLFVVLSAAVLLGPAPTPASADPLGPGERFFQFYGGLDLDPAVPAPQEVFGHAIGERFTRHDQIIDYVRAVADASDRVTIEQYGWSHQRRPLVICTITSPDNHANLDDILSANRELADPTSTNRARADEIARTNPAVSWLSYNVHGNEASCSEAALRVLYTLAAGRNAEIDNILEKTVVVIDPCLNPDGRARYVSFYQQSRGVRVNEDPHAIEHNEPWPSGRSNHYMFDLNRDWVWGVHPESRSRVEIYRRYMPQLHVDYHEQGANSPYFFGAGDTPYNLNIPDESKDWFDRYGRASAEVFDRYGLPYATKERFDYLYPGYGKVLPCYHGAVGLLTEQAGHGRGGLALEIEDEHGPRVVLTLKRRAHNHFLTSMAYLDLTATQRRAQLERFYRFFAGSMETGDYPTSAFIISADNDPARLAKIKDLCDRHGIRIRTLREETTLSDARSYFPPFDADGSTTVPAGSWIIPSAQPMGRLARTLFERDTELEDIDTYDITSWTVPVLFGVTAYELRDGLDTLALGDAPAPVRLTSASPSTDDAIALLVPADQHHFPRVLAIATEHDLFARLTDDDIRFSDGREAPRGSLLVHVFRNDADALQAFARDLAGAGLESFATTEGYPPVGPALGNNANARFIPPDIVLLRGSPVSSLSFGHTWHMLDIESPTPYSAVDYEDLDDLDWDETNVLVLPSAWALDRVFPESELDGLKSWIRDGGTVVAISRSAHWASSKVLGLEEEDDDEAEGDGDDPYAGDDDEQTPDDDEDLSALTYDEREQRSVQDRIPGAILASTVDQSHPLAIGIEPMLGWHVFGEEPLPVDEEGFVVARFAEIDDQAGPRIGGSISEENLNKLAGTPAVTHHRLGGGNVICFASDPTNRGMNHAGMRVLLNAILLGPSVSPALQPLGAGAVHTHDEEDQADRHRHD